MKKRDFSEFKAKGIDDLRKRIAELKKQYVESLLQIKMGKTKNVHEGKNMRKDLARLNTIFRLKLLTEELKQKEATGNKKEVSNAAG